MQIYKILHYYDPICPKKFTLLPQNQSLLFRYNFSNPFYLGKSKNFS